MSVVLPPPRYRFAAGVIDLLIIAATFGAVLMVLPDRSPEVGGPALAANLALVLVVLVQGLSAGQRSATVGQWLLSTTVVHAVSGKPAGLVKTLLRAALGAALLPIGFASWWTAMRHPARRAWQDQLTRTLVIADPTMRCDGDAGMKQLALRG